MKTQNVVQDEWHFMNNSSGVDMSNFQNHEFKRERIISSPLATEIDTNEIK